MFPPLNLGVPPNLPNKGGWGFPSLSRMGQVGLAAQSHVELWCHPLVHVDHPGQVDVTMEPSGTF
jgi:hypothetical protein